MSIQAKFQKTFETLSEKGRGHITEAKAQAMHPHMRKRDTCQPQLTRWERYHGGRFIVLEHDEFLEVYTLRLETILERKTAKLAALQLKIFLMQETGCTARELEEIAPAPAQVIEFSERWKKIHRGSAQPEWMPKYRSYRAG